MLVDVSELVVFDQRHEEPERNVLCAVHEEGPDDEVHALHVAYRIVVFRKRGEHFG